MSLKNIALATAAAGLFIAAAAAPALAAEGDAAKVKCEGVNSCKGQGACKSAHNACAGQNACAGKGFLSLTQAECDAAKANHAAEKK
ncbi:MAG TPA: hypothetical protein VMW35_19550 [Myxococcota bacterium]|jgi:hypothetical protein|nr:hypothetical protein [Myxococcota bacterium]